MIYHNQKQAIGLDGSYHIRLGKQRGEILEQFLALHTADGYADA